MSDESWQETWKGKVVTAAEAIRLVPRGRRILIGSGAAEPARLVDALVGHGQHLADNEIVHLLTLGPAPYTLPGMEDRFRHTAFFIGENVRGAVQEGRADFMPVFLSEIPELIRSRRVRIDVAMIQVSPPDSHGYVSLGVSVDVVRAAVEAADLVIAEVNPRMPRTLGDSFLHVSRIAALVPVDYPLFVRERELLDEVTRAIGRNVASLVPDGATLQVGIGGIPDAVLASLFDRRDLGVHTEMFSDGVMELAKAGVVTGARKTLLPGKIVTSFIMGTQGLYEWAADNPAIEMRPSSFTNDPFTIARNDDMIAINSALAVDLTGQVAADTLFGRFFSGIGGQVDFIRGAARSRRGKPIIALPSTAKKGTCSRIQAGFDAGAGVVTSRGDVHYVVTEYGVADLWGKNIRERAMGLIEIAHPDHRSELLAKAKERRFVFFDQRVPRAIYPWEEVTRHELKGPAAQSARPTGTGSPIALSHLSHETIAAIDVRPVRMSDEEQIQDLFYRLSEEATYRRFLMYKRVHPHEEMLHLVDLDYEQNMALVATVADGPTTDIVAITRYDVDPATKLADIAFAVRDDWQQRGIGTILMRRMSEIAKARGLAGFTADVLASNRPMLDVFAKSGLVVRTEREGSTYHLTILFEDPAGKGARHEPARTAEPSPALRGLA